MQQKGITILYSLVLAGFCLLMIEGFFDFHQEEPLQGSYAKISQPVFSVADWMDGSFQEQEEKYINENVGFGNSLIRWSNQLNYSLLGVAKASGVCVGKEGYLFEEGYINTYYGRDYIGREQVEEFARKTKLVQEKLKLRKIDLLVVFAPAKGAFFPEFIPNGMKGEETTSNNYSAFSTVFEQEGINMVDFYRWFLAMKPESKYPLYPKTGIHWSAYGEILAGDSLLRHLKGLTGKNLPMLAIDTIEEKATLSNGDRDIERGMNLLYDIPNHKMAYPKYHLEKGSAFLKAMVVADSYYWGLFNKSFSKHYLNNGQFWYYNEEIYQFGAEKREVNSVNVKEEVEQHQTVILLSTDMNLHRFSFGFIDELYELYNLSEAEEYTDRVNFYEKRIRETKGWYSRIAATALEKNASLDSLITKNAQYMVWKDDQP